MRPGGRVVSVGSALFVVAVATLFGVGTAHAGSGALSARGATFSGGAVPGQAVGKPCSTEEWRNPANFQACVDGLEDVSQGRLTCLKAPTPEAPDSGMAGWFAGRTDAYNNPGPKGLYTRYGYAGYGYTTYDIGCGAAVIHADYKFENTVANGEFMMATAVVGASNALRERAWDPKSMWGWADPLVEKATTAVYRKVFTVFGAITLSIVGLYLLWRSRQSDLSGAMTTAGWALFVMVGVTAIASWPTWSANLADKSLIGSLSVIHEAVGPPSHDTPPGKCVFDPRDCKDHRPPAVRASDTAVDGMLYRNYIRGLLGSADSETARKYGPVLYDAKSNTWGENEDIRKDAKQRQVLIEQKQKRWMKVAEQIKTEDPEAYEYLKGAKGMDRVGSGVIAILAALFFAMFDLTASILVLLGFLIFRWAVIAAPILGTMGLLRPASGGLRRLGNAVIAALFNIIIFGTGAAIYLFGVDLIMSTASLPGWLQVVLIWLTGVVGWLLLRPYRRITQLGGKESSATVTSTGNWQRLFFRDARQAEALKIANAGATEPAVGTRHQVVVQTQQRPETRTESVVVAAANRPETGIKVPTTVDPTGESPRQRTERTPRWTEPDVADGPANYTIYRPDSGETTAPARPVRRPESASVPR